MLSSNSSSCNHNPNPNPFPEYDIPYFRSSRSQQDPNFFFAFPNSPHMHLQYDDVPDLDHFLDNFYHHQSLNTNTPATQNTAADHNPTSAAAAAVKKDRHSKINTARGPRDRRMRLSLDIARKFFDLQDLLGYDKASRTVDWLLRSSRTAIRELARASSSCTSEDCCEAWSSSTTDKMTAEAAATTAVEASSCTKINNCRRVKRGRVQVHQKRASVGRESRKKARERARERTSQKRRLMKENSNAAAAAAAAAGTVFVMSGEDLSSDETRISGATNEGVFLFNSHHNNHNINALFTLHQEEQIAEFQFNGKLWEAYNSFNMSG